MTLLQQLSWKQRWHLFRRGSISVEVPENPTSYALPEHLRAYQSIDLVKWCTDKDRVGYSQKLLADPLFRELLGVLATVRPAMPKAQMDAVQAAVLLGQRTGHDEIIACILASARLVEVPQEPVQADYGASEIDWSKQ